MYSREKNIELNITLYSTTFLWYIINKMWLDLTYYKIEFLTEIKSTNLFLSFYTNNSVII
jgi:hypothetical protein